MDRKKLEITERLKDPDLHLWQYIGSGNRLVVCFSPTGEDGFQGPSFPSTASNKGKNHVLFISDPQRTWLNAPGLREKIKYHVQKFKDEVKPTSIVTLGHSMGGFYALACAADIGATSAVALAPQVTVHPEIAGDDKRWLNFRSRISKFRYEHVDELLTDDPQYFIVHGAMRRENAQRDRTPKRKNITHIILPETHHNVPARLKREGIQDTFIKACFDVDKAAAFELLKPLQAYERTLTNHPMLEPVSAPRIINVIENKPEIKTLEFDTQSITYFFVMDGADYEAPAILLAASLRANLSSNVKIIAYTPPKNREHIHPLTLLTLSDLGVEVCDFDSDQVSWNPKYPHGNKILASCEKRTTDLSVFLDTDIVCIGQPNFDLVTPETPLFAVPEGVPTWGADTNDWKPVYDMFKLELPNWRVRMVKGRGKVVLPYFNAGVVGFVEHGNSKGQRLPDLWLDTAQRIDSNPHINNKRPWLDQIALPVAAARMNGRVEVHSSIDNFSPYRNNDLTDLSPVNFFHYRMPSYFRRHPECRKITEDLLGRYPVRRRHRLRRKLRLFLRGIDLPKHLEV